uniref:Aryl hydrocarbon receptor nuclear translocator like n=1 Tax=Cebus imitator TaxID=2715852 RepID=A0A2K5Q5E5_CEBIM
MADQRMNISSTISDFMSRGPTDLLSSSLGTSGVDCNCKRKGSFTDYMSNLGSTIAGGQIKNKKCKGSSQIEKRCQNKMNSFIDELASLVPTCNAMFRKLDKLTVLRMAVQHMKTLRGATNPYTEANYKPTFLSDDKLKHLILSAADGFSFVVGCDRGKILFVSESVFKILSYSQNDLIGQSLFDYLHPKDIAKVKEQLSSSDTAPQEQLIDAKTGLPVKTDITPGPSRSYNEGCNLSCLVFHNRSTGEIRVKSMEYVSQHAIDGEFVFVDQRAMAILAYLPQELLGTSCYEYFHQDDIGHLAECHRQVLQMREKITTNCYKFKIKDGSFITLWSRWLRFMNPWTKQIEYIASANTVVLANILEGEDPTYLQLTASPQQHGQRWPKRGTHPTVPGISGGPWAGAGKIGQMIAKEIMEIHRIRRLSPSSCGSSPLNITSMPPTDASSPGGKKILNGRTPDIPSSGQAQENPGYPHSDSPSILGENPHIGIDMIDNDQGSSSPNAGLSGTDDFSNLTWPL